MNGAYEIGAIALRSQQKALDAMANNIANMNTPTYRRSEVQFSEIVSGGASTVSATQPQSSAAISSNGGVRLSIRPSMQIMGDIRSTGNAQDIAIDGKGFIELMGPRGEVLLWRGGALDINEDGYLAAKGYSLLASISIPDDAHELSISPDGKVRALSSEDEVLELGEVNLVKAEFDGAVERLDDGLYRLEDGYRVQESVPGEDGAGRIMQGFVEGSNVDLTQEMVQLLMVQRAYAASAQIIQTADQLAAITNNLKK